MNKKMIQECHEEKIEYFNEIQPFGYLIGIDVSTFEIEFVSENISLLFSENPMHLIGKKITDYLNIEIDCPKILSLDIGEFDRDSIEINSQTYHLTTYHNSDIIYLELESLIVVENRSSYHHISEQLLYTKSIEDNWKLLINSIKELIGYDRVMIYQFLEDNSGVVVAENVDEGLDSYLGLRFPEFDIPEQVRLLYIKKKSRMVADIDDLRIKMISREDKVVDLTYTSIRAFSVSHIEYLRNAKAFGSFSVSIVINDRLWGLVACQNSTPKYIPNQVRLQSELLTRLARLTYVNFKSNERLQFQNHFNKIAMRLKENLLVEDSLQNSIQNNIHEILHLTDADGIALVTHENVFTHGHTPEVDEIFRIKKWAKVNEISTLFFSNPFLIDYKETLNLTSDSAGVMFSFLDQHCQHFIIWFKKEEIYNINWAGNPTKIENTKIIDEIETLYFSPRKSFKVWQEEIGQKSFVWKENEIFVAKEVLKLIVETLHIQSFKIHSLYEQLQEINEELDSFSYTISHDLRTPLTVMKLNCQILQRTLGDSEMKEDRLKSVISEIDRMTEMMQEILILSKAKKSEIVLKEIETRTIIDKIVQDVLMYYNAENTHVEIENIEHVFADKTMVFEVFQNIIGNAVKYSSTQKFPKVFIKSQIIDDQVVYEISDNGIGIKEDDYDKMFKLFSRMSNTGNIQGNGVGLSIVLRMMNRMDGDINFESKEGEGTTFVLRFKKP